jgi:biopolymer transport protein ExbD
MKFKQESKVQSTIPTASMADIAFLLLIFFMVSTVFVLYHGLPVNLPEAYATEKLGSRRNVTSIWLTTRNETMIDDMYVDLSQIAKIMGTKLSQNPQLVISMKIDKDCKYGAVSDVFEELKKGQALQVNLGTDKERKRRF